MTLIVTLIPPAAFSHSEIEYFGPFPGIAFEHGVLSPAVAIFHHVGAGTEFWSLVAKPRSDRFHMCHVLHGQAVFESQFLASPHFFGGPSDLKGLDMKREDQVGTQTADGLGDTLVQSAHH